MLKSILDKAISECKNTSHFYPDKSHQKILDKGYNLAKAEMRAKIPQVVEEVIEIVKKCRLPQNTKGENGFSTLVYIPNEDFNVAINDRLEWIIKSLTVENSAQKEDKEI